MTCPTCGAESPAGFRFCGRCGAELAVQAADQHESRKTVTLLFCDVAGSTALGEQLDPEALRRVMSRYFDEITAVISRHGGTVEKFVGDAVMAVFGIPRVREDDALRAVRAAAEIRDRLPAVAAELGVTLSWRTGVNTGEVVVGAGQTLATGDGINVAARLEQAAAPGEILLGPETHRLVQVSVEVEAVEPLTLKGKSEPVPAYRLVSVVTTQPGERPDRQSVFVGRERELTLLSYAFDRVQEGACHLFTLMGSAGVGKSRLVARFLDEVSGRATIARGRCLSYGDAITFFPIVDVLTQLGDDGADALRLISDGGAATPNEVFLSVRRTFERVAGRRPLVVVLDDLHWAEPMLLDLVDHIADLSRGAPLLLLCISRPELLDHRPGWGGGKLNATTVLLEPLHPGECQELLDTVAHDLDPLTREHVVAASEGNPLFAVEMVALALEGGDVSASPTIAAILAARLDQLDEDERSVIERGAVEGKVFHSGAVRALAPGLASTVDQRLSSLVRKDLVRPDPGEASIDDDAYRFRHVLVRDAAYDALPKRVRAELHEQFADWLETHAVGLVELAELVGWHLEQAVRYRRELGLDIAAGLAGRAGAQLQEAADHALARADSRAADKLLTRALELLPDTDPRRHRALVFLARLTVQNGDLERADRLIAEIEVAEETPDGIAVRLEWLGAAAPERVTAYVDEHAAPMLQRLRGSDDHAGLAALHFAMFQLRWLAADAGGAWEQLELAGEHARLSGDSVQQLQIQAVSTGPLMFGPTPADEMARVLAERETSSVGPMVEAGLFMLRSCLAFMRGELADARAHAHKAREMLYELGLTVLAACMTDQEAEPLVVAGELDEAIALLRGADAELAALGERGYRSTVIAQLSRALRFAGELDEAERVALEAMEISSPDDLINFVITQAVRAHIYADRGDLVTAEQLARSSLAYAERTDFPIQRADARAALARVLGLSGQVDEAIALLQEAVDLCARKGDRVRTDQMQAKLADLQASG